jgi:hypothetical protein
VTAWRFFFSVGLAALVAAIAPASAQSLGAFDESGSVGLEPMSLLPLVPSSPPVRAAGKFVMPAPAEAAPPPETGTPEASAALPADAAEEGEAAPARIARVPLPPRRPFNLGLSSRKKPLLAKAEVIAPKTEVRTASVTRSLVPLEDLPGVRTRDDSRGNGRLIQQASLQNEVMSDASPPLPDIVPKGKLGYGILKQTPNVQTACLRAELIAILHKASKRFGRPVVITSGFRAGGRRGSYHRKCSAADVMITGVSKATLAAYFRTLPEAGGVGTYCHNGVVHIDTAEPRNWTYCGFRRTSFSLRNGGWRSAQAQNGKALPDDGGID